MTIKTGAVAGRRVLKFENLDDLQREAERVASLPGKTLGNWSTAQIVDHLAKSIRATYDGPEVTGPWFVRMIVWPIIKSRMLAKGMPAGFSVPKKMAHFLPDNNPILEASLRDLRTWLGRLKTEAPRLGHPLFGKLSHRDWIRLHLRHGELHLSFVAPEAM